MEQIRNYVVFACPSENTEDVTENWYPVNEYQQAYGFFNNCTGHAQLSLVINENTPGIPLAVKQAGKLTYINDKYDF